MLLWLLSTERVVAVSGCPLPRQPHHLSLRRQPPRSCCRWDAATGEPTHDKEGAALEGKALDKARKEVEKQKKVGRG